MKCTGMLDRLLTKGNRENIVKATKGSGNKILLLLEGEKAMTLHNWEQTRVIFFNAYQWLCTSRKKHPHNADIWDFIWN